MAIFKNSFIYCCLLFAFISSNAQNMDSMNKVFAGMPGNKQKALLALDIAGGYLQQRSIDSCVFYLNNAISLAQQLHDDSIVMESENMLGMAVASHRKFDVAVEHYKKAIMLADNLHLPQRKVNVMYHEVEAIRESGDLDRSFVVCKDALELATSIKDMKSVAKFYTVMARYYKSKGQVGLAVDYLSRCVHLNDSFKNYADMAFSYGKIAGIYSSQGDMKNAIKFSLLADSIYTKTGDERGRNYNYIDMSSFYNIMGDFRNGVDVALKAQKYFANDTDQYMLYQLYL